MNFIDGMMIVLQLWCVLIIIGLYIYMIYVTNYKNDQFMNLFGGLLCMFFFLISPIKYLFTKHEIFRRKVIISSIFYSFVLIFYFTLIYRNLI